MQPQDKLIEAELEDNGITLEQLSTICAVEPNWITQHIEEGLLEPLQQQTEWRFTSAHLVRVQRIMVLERDFEAIPELAALVADLQEEIETLRKQLLRAGLE
jgi:chaperone modulatory protein CbpM